MNAGVKKKRRCLTTKKCRFVTKIRFDSDVESKYENKDVVKW